MNNLKKYFTSLAIMLLSSITLAQTSPNNYTTQSTNPTIVNNPTQDTLKCDSVCITSGTYSTYSNTTTNTNLIKAQTLTLISPVIGGNGKGGTKTGTTCVGLDLYDTWSDGTQSLNTANAPACQPPPPTKNGTVCVSYDLYDTWSDGTKTLNTTNSTTCGYVAPTPPSPPAPSCIGNQISGFVNFCSGSNMFYYNGCLSNGSIMTWGGMVGFDTPSCPGVYEYQTYGVQCFCW
jgi:hypothetical protein